jgi:hypothetical protein
VAATSSTPVVKLNDEDRGKNLAIARRGTPLNLVYEVERRLSTAKTASFIEKLWGPD